MSKSELRKVFLAKRAKLTATEVVENSSHIYERFISQYPLINRTVHCFKSIPGSKEIITNDFFNHCHLNEINIGTSITKFKPKRLEHSLITSNTVFKADNFGVPTPTEQIEFDIEKLDIVVVPLLCCDSVGNRIGYGQGFYDSFLMQLCKKTLKIGVSYFEPIKENIPVDSWDVKLDGMITPSDIFIF
ncbi:MAG: 5-formyltetrahydrofolate cyclo-ligase [Flavobacteriales bacterium]|jgi:5-formyltetrahydrofolate cyclo-ligase